MQERLLVLPNPYTFIDGDGEPQGACPADPDHAGGKRMWIGAKLDPQRTKFLEDHKDRRNGLRWKGDPRPRPQAVKFKFSTEPVDIPSTPHYLDRIREGSLIAADPATFHKTFGSRAKYVLPVRALAEARQMAFDEYKAAHGKDPAFTREEAAASPAGQLVAEANDGAVEIDALAEQLRRLPSGTNTVAVPDYERTGIPVADTAPAEAPGGMK